VSNEDITQESVMEIQFPITQSAMSGPPYPAIRPKLQKMESRMDIDTRTSPDLFPKRLCFEETSANAFDRDWRGKIERQYRDYFALYSRYICAEQIDSLLGSTLLFF
jgi:hypothetical protein